MKRVAVVFTMGLLISCNVSVDERSDNDSATKVDSFIEKADTTLEKWGDTAKKKLKDAGHAIKQQVNEHFKKDSVTIKFR